MNILREGRIARQRTGNGLKDGQNAGINIVAAEHYLPFLLFLFALAAHAAELPPNPPGFELGAINLTDGASGAATGVSRSPAIDAPVGQGQGIDTPTIQISVVTDSLTTQTNDAPVRRWNGAMVITIVNNAPKIKLTGGSVTFVTSNLISVSGVVDIEELSRAVALRRTTPPPPMPPSTNTNESATMRAMNTTYLPTEAQKAMLKFFKDGGQKGRGH